MLKPRIISHFNFTAFPTIFCREAFARQEGNYWRVYAGVQNGGWQTDELFFSERLGAFNGIQTGANPTRTVAAGLDLVGATLETVAIDARGEHNFDPLLRVASGVALTAKSSTNYSTGSQSDYQISGASGWYLYNANSGQLVAQTGSGGTLGLVPDGSYLLWAHAGGEWSAIKVRVGAGAFGWTSTVYAGPGSPLYSKVGESEIVVNGGNEALYVQGFDPLARIVSASCVTTRDVRLANGETEDGEVDIPAGSLLIAGVRASRGGPQTAFWLLRPDRSARLLGAETTFSNGICECAKTNHFASDIQQGADGRIYILSECDCSVYDPNRTDVFNRLRPFPEETYGHPGGQAIRFPAGDVAFWSEGGAAAPLDGAAWYNGLIYRAGTQNFGSVSSRWHGTNCGEVFRGKLFAVRQDPPKIGEEPKQTLDSITAGRWDRVSNLTQSALNGTWQRVRRMGSNLLAFGFKTVEGVELSTLHIARERSFEEAEFPFFIRKATPAWYSDGTARLILAARFQTEAVGIANRVVEIEEVASRICSNWDEANSRFSFSQSEFLTLGGNLQKLPPFLRFVPQTGTDAGGYWKGVETIPNSGSFLTLSVVAGQIRYSGTLPYDATFWGILCMEIDGDGDGEVTWEIDPTCEGADCVIDHLPDDGTKWRHLRLTIPDAGDPLWSLQISDVNADKRLQLTRDQIPILWLRTDSTAPFEDLSSYKTAAKFGREIFLEEPALRTVDVMVIYPEETMPCAAPVVERRS